MLLYFISLEFVKIAAGDMIENIGNLNYSDNPLARLKDKIVPFLGLADEASTCKREGAFIACPVWPSGRD